MRTVCDLHTCLPLELSADPDVLTLHLAAGASFVSVNVGMEVTPLRESIALLQSFRERLGERRDRYVLANSVADLEDAARTGRLAVAFDLEGASQLAGRNDGLIELSRLGVSSVQLTEAWRDG